MTIKDPNSSLTPGNVINPNVKDPRTVRQILEDSIKKRYGKSREELIEEANKQAEKDAKNKRR